MESLERRFKGLELEWGDTYDKLRRALSRIAKTRAIMEAKESETEAAELSPEATGSRPTPVGGFLTEKQKVIQQQILRRRAGG